MRRARFLATLFLLPLLAPFAGCGDDDPAAPPAPAPTPEALAYFSFNAGVGSPNVADAASVSFHVGPDGADFALFDVTVTNADAGRTIAIDPGEHPEFAQAVLLLTNGTNDGVAFRRAPLGGASAITRSDEETSFAGGVLADQEPDFAGAEVTGISLVLDAISIDSPGRDPNGNGQWTDVTVQGQIVVLGHP